MPAMRADKSLVDLLLNMFSADELRRFVRWGPEGDRLAMRLPTGAVSLAELAHAVVDVWEREGQLEPSLFDRLVVERPRRQAEIRAVQEKCAAPLPVPPPSASPAADALVAPRELRAPGVEGPLDYLIAVALPLEHEAVCGLLEETGDRTLKDGTVVGVHRLASATRGEVAVGVVITGMSNEAAALVVASAVRELNPRAVAFVGVAGGLKPDDARVGDVVVATKVYGFDFGKDTDGGFQPRPEVANSAYRFVQRAQYEAGRTGWLKRVGAEPTEADRPRVHVKPIAAGSVRVAGATSAAAQRLRESYGDAYAVEMEGYGALRALDQARVEGVIVRGISDQVAERIADKDAARAARNAAGFALELLAKI
jgi:nucleoside phosphorylase